MVYESSSIAQHFWHLMARVWHQAKEWNSATTFSLIKESVVLPIAGFLIALRFSIGKGWWKLSILRARGSDVLKAFFVAVALPLSVLGLVCLVATPVTIYQDYGRLVDQNDSLSTQLKAKPVQVTSVIHDHDPATPPDPSMIKTGAVLTMLGAMRNALKDRPPAEFLVTAPKENAWVKTDLEAAILETCDKPPAIACLILPPQPEELIPAPKHQGLKIHIKEPVEKAQVGNPFNGNFLIDTLPASTSFLFAVHQDQYIPEPILQKFQGSIPYQTFVWIEVGNGPPWSADDIRFRDGVPPQMISNLGGWDISTKKRLDNAYVKLSKLNDNLRRMSAPSFPSLPGYLTPAALSALNAEISKYETIRAEIVLALRDARTKERIDTGETEALAWKKPLDYKDVDVIGKVTSGLARIRDEVKDTK